MKLRRAHGLAALLAIAFLIAPVLNAGNLCNLAPTNCATACAGGCAFSVAVAHPSANPCTPGAGSFNFTGVTPYAGGCTNGIGGCAGTPTIPPVRFWQYDNYKAANSGCQQSAATDWWLSDVDLGVTGTAPNRYILFQANYQGPNIDGCVATPRSVVEVAFVDQLSNNTAQHSSWYALVSVDQTAGFDLDRVTGALATCQPGDILMLPVPALTIVGRTAACTANATVTLGTANTNAGFFDVNITLNNASPSFYTEVSPNTINLIAGYQILYSPTTEPTSSNQTTGNWTPVLDTTTPTMAKGVVPYGTANTSITLPNGAAGTRYWLAARLVYTDASLNPTGTFTPGPTNGPQVTSFLSSHCGPVSAPGGPVAVQYGSVEGRRTSRGVEITWSTLKEDDTNGFVVVRSTKSDMTESRVDAVPWVDAAGQPSSYSGIDTSIAPSDHATYYYQVQEVTSSGLGTVSPVVAVSEHVQGSGSGRSRGRARR